MEGHMELARRMMRLDEDADGGEIERELMENYGVTAEGFRQLTLDLARSGCDLSPPPYEPVR